MSNKSRDELIKIIVGELTNRFLYKNPGYARGEIEKRYKFMLFRKDTRLKVKKNLLIKKQKTMNYEDKVVYGNLINLIEIVYKD